MVWLFELWKFLLVFIFRMFLFNYVSLFEVFEFFKRKEEGSKLKIVSIRHFRSFLILRWYKFYTFFDRLLSNTTYSRLYNDLETHRRKPNFYSRKQTSVVIKTRHHCFIVKVYLPTPLSLHGLNPLLHDVSTLSVILCLSSSLQCVVKSQTLVSLCPY